MADILYELGAAELIVSAWEANTAEDLPARLESLQVEAWEALYLTHRSLVRGVLAGCLGYSQDLEVLAQSVFVVALNRVAAKSDAVPLVDSAMRTWLVAFSVQVSGLEQKQREANAAVGLPQESSQLLHHTHCVLGRLPSLMRLPWILRHLEKMSIADIAAATRVPVATVKVRLKRADASFRRLAKRDPVLRACLE